jgi:hypothetical protein
VKVKLHEFRKRFQPLYKRDVICLPIRTQGSSFVRCCRGKVRNVGVRLPLALTAQVTATFLLLSQLVTVSTRFGPFATKIRLGSWAVEQPDSCIL